MIPNDVNTTADYQFSGRTESFTYDAEPHAGPDTILMEADDNLIEGRSWEEKGYAIFGFLPPARFNQLRTSLLNWLREQLNQLVDLPVDFNFETYHQHVASEQLHREFLEIAYGGIRFADISFSREIIEDRISRILGVEVTTKTASMPGQEDVLLLRFVRPGKSDYNPLHRDVWLDRIRNGVNIYVPLAGSTADSSLALIPGSHYWKESQVYKTPTGSFFNGKKFTVPAVIQADYPLSAILPNPGMNEVLIFSPYLIHGAASTHNRDSTRLSIELRFWRKISSQ